MTPQRKLKIFKRLFFAIAVIVALLLFVSLVSTASNFMVVQDMNTDAEL